MFKFLKDKIKETVSRISRKVEEEEIIETPEEEIVEIKPKKEKKAKEKKKSEKKQKEVEEVEQEPEEIIEEAKEEVKTKLEEPKEKKGFFSIFKRKVKDEYVEEPIEEEVEVETEKAEQLEEELKIEEKEIEKQEEKKSIFAKLKEKVTTTKISEDRFNELFEDLEVTLLENNVAFDVVDKIKEDLKKDLLEKAIKRGEVETKIIDSLKESIEDLFLTPSIKLIEQIKEKQEKPYVICFVGQNGAGKTTTIAKVAHLLKKNNISSVIAASDTFRAGSINQLKEWGAKLNVKVIAHDYGSDPAAVAFDAKNYCQAHKIEVLLIDTAGRQHTNADLMRELEKIVRVTKPDLKIFIGEAITGNDAVEQAKEFKDLIGIDGIILTKADVDEKGGAIVSVSHVTHRPIMYLGVGQQLGDLEEFNKEKILKNLGL